jgi:hypothetical protein
MENNDFLYLESQTVETKNGERKITNIEPSYLYDLINVEAREYVLICDKLTSICRKLDTTEEDKAGNLFINWFPGEVFFKFKHESKDGKQYLIEVIKQGVVLNLKINEAGQ